MHNKSNGAALTSFVASMSAPASRSIDTKSSWPVTTATMTAVYPDCERVHSRRARWCPSNHAAEPLRARHARRRRGNQHGEAAVRLDHPPGRASNQAGCGASALYSSPPPIHLGPAGSFKAVVGFARGCTGAHDEALPPQQGSSAGPANQAAHRVLGLGVRAPVQQHPHYSISAMPHCCR